MSSSLSTDSGQTNAETEFMEIEVDTCPIVEQDMDDENCVRPYEGEPVADDEWIAQYKAKINATEERLQIHWNRLEGLETLNNWYV